MAHPSSYIDLLGSLVAAAAAGNGAVNGAGSEQRMLVITISLFISLICICIVVGHLLEGIRWFNEYIVAIVVGCFAGLTVDLLGGSPQILDVDEQLFFVYFLPPIIFYAGFQVKKKQFFHNFGTIVLFGGVGVFVSSVVIAAGCMYLFPRLNLAHFQTSEYLSKLVECVGTNGSWACKLAIGVIFSATDTVATLQTIHQEDSPLLYSVVFGEGVVNDATAVVLSRAVQRLGIRHLSSVTSLNTVLNFVYLFSLSTLLGVAAGLMTAYSLKTLYVGRHSTEREISLMALVAYLTYTVAELFHLSGILAVFFCGILMSHYSWHNVSHDSQVTSRHSFATMSFVSETFMFVYVGTDVLNMDKWRQADIRKSVLICGILLVLIAVARAAFVFPLSALSNYVRGTSSSRLTFRYQVVIWWAGLLRGAVSIALAYQQFAAITYDSTMTCATIGVVLFTTLILGTLTKPVAHALLSNEVLPAPSKLEYSQFDGEQSLRRGSSLSLLLSDPTLAVHNFWRSFDDMYMRPVFGGSVFVPFTA